MKLIHKFKSPSFNKRKAKHIKYIIIHYTALQGIDESINYLCNPLIESRHNTYKLYLTSSYLLKRRHIFLLVF